MEGDDLIFDLVGSGNKGPIQMNDKLTDAQLDELLDIIGPWSENGSHFDTIKLAILELRELRKLRDEVEPVLRWYSHHYPYIGGPAHLFLARHFGKEQEK